MNHIELSLTTLLKRHQERVKKLCALSYKYSNAQFIQTEWLIIDPDYLRPEEYQKLYDLAKEIYEKCNKGEKFEDQCKHNKSLLQDALNIVEQLGHYVLDPGSHYQDDDLETLDYQINLKLEDIIETIEHGTEELRRTMDLIKKATE